MRHKEYIITLPHNARDSSTNSSHETLGAKKNVRL